MKKLSLLSKIPFVLLLLASCGNPSPKSKVVTDSQNGCAKTNEKIDSNSESADIVKDSTKTMPFAGDKSAPQVVEGGKINPASTLPDKNKTVGKAIVHGSAEQQKLDSIKKAKGKIKYK